MPLFIERILLSRGFYTVAATVLTFVFWWSGLHKLANFGGAMGEMAHFNLAPTWLFAALTIATQLIGSLLIITASRFAWLGAGALSVFTLILIPIAHPFWTKGGVVAFLERALVQDHISVIGGLMVAAALASWRHKNKH